MPRFGKKASFFTFFKTKSEFVRFGKDLEKKKKLRFEPSITVMEIHRYTH
jgi:hypothetical protein